MPILRMLTDKLVVRATRKNAYESKFLRKYFERTYGMKIGLYSSSGCFDRWRLGEGITVGRYCSISITARVIDANHPIDSLSTHPFFYLKDLGVVASDLHKPRPPVIEDDVWLGHYAIVGPGCARVGRGSIIGAGSVVARDVPRYAIMMGSPAQLIRYRFPPEVINAVEATEWWLLDKEELARGLRKAEDFLVSPTVDSARMFLSAIGRSERPVSSFAKELTQSKPSEAAVSNQSAKVPRSDIFELIRAEVPLLTPENVDSSFEQLGLDSLGYVLLRSACERLFQKAISDQAWGLISTPSELIAFLSDKKAALEVIPLAKSSVERIERTVELTTVPASAAHLHWLPQSPTWNDQMKEVERDIAELSWVQLVSLAKYNLDTSQTGRLDRSLLKYTNAHDNEQLYNGNRVAVIGSSTLSHLLPSIRVGALRHGLRVITYEGEYGQYFHELGTLDSKLYAFKPDIIVLAVDGAHLARGLDAGTDADASEIFFQEIITHLRQCWRMAREKGILLIQQTALPVFRSLLGNNEQRLPGSKQIFISRLNSEMRKYSEQEGFDLLSIDSMVSALGLDAWHDPIYWHRAKQEIRPDAAPLFGDMLGRILAAHQGRSYKCLVLDLDNTLWGGVIGDDGVEGIVLGQGSAQGEAFQDFQQYALQLAKRGVILAVCSKNDKANAIEAFEKHPEMILKLSDISSFVANWNDKASNIRRIANELNIGLDAIVFVDDNPFERSLVRAELPMVAVPELPLEPALFARTLSDAGYFEGLAITGEDRERTRLYEANAERANLEAAATDMSTYLGSLEMKLRWGDFDSANLQRVVQLINKTNQFNLTSKRYTEDEVRNVIADANAFGIQFRLGDRFGDNGIISVVIGRRVADEVVIDTWLMSCRVLGRQVEMTVLNLIAARAKAISVKRLVGEYRATAKNGMVRDHYARLGFVEVAGEESLTRWVLDLRNYLPRPTFANLEPAVEIAVDLQPLLSSKQ